MGVIDWYRVPGSEFTRSGKAVGGYYNRYTKRIVLAEAGIQDGPVVLHEMLHALTRTGGHARSQFLGACAGLVRCEERCVSDAGRWVPTQRDYVVLKPDSLDVASRAQLLPREVDGQRWVALEITVRNPRGRAVLVATPEEAMTPRTFGFKVAGPLGGISMEEVAADSSTLFFRPFETKRRLFEFLVTSDLSRNHLTPGAYAIAGAYVRRWGAFDTIAVSP